MGSCCSWPFFDSHFTIMKAEHERRKDWKLGESWTNRSALSSQLWALARQKCCSCKRRYPHSISSNNVAKLPWFFSNQMSLSPHNLRNFYKKLREPSRRFLARMSHPLVGPSNCHNLFWPHSLLCNLRGQAICGAREWQFVGPSNLWAWKFVGPAICWAHQFVGPENL